MSNTDPIQKLIPTRAVCDRYGLKALRSLRRWVLSGAIPPPDVTINNRHYWWQSTLEQHERRQVANGAQSSTANQEL